VRRALQAMAGSKNAPMSRMTMMTANAATKAAPPAPSAPTTAPPAAVSTFQAAAPADASLTPVVTAFSASDGLFAVSDGGVPAGVEPDSDSPDGTDSAGRRPPSNANAAMAMSHCTLVEEQFVDGF